MERYPNRLYVRLSDGEKRDLEKAAGRYGMDVSSLVRLLIQQAARDGGSESAVRSLVLDRETTLRLARELRAWGYHYNQAVHALNTISWCLRNGEADSLDVRDGLEGVRSQLAEIQTSAREIRRSAAEMSRQPVLFL